MVDLYNRAKLQRDILVVRGKDRYSFLQGLITNDVFLLKTCPLLYSGFLTPQGKFLHDFFLFEEDDTLILDLFKGEGESAAKRLLSHKLRADVSISLENQGRSIFAFFPRHEVAITPNNLSLLRDPRHPALGYRILAFKPPENVPSSHVEESDYNHYRLRQGITEGALDLVKNHSTAMEGNLDLLNAISWSKGCYRGQEITARMHYRGLVKKRLCVAQFEGKVPPFLCPITVNNSEVGSVRSTDLSLAMIALDLTLAAQTNRDKIILQAGGSTLFLLESSLKIAIA